MPVESVAVYISNTFIFAIFVLVSIIFFLLLFLISAWLRKRVLNRNRKIPYRVTDEPEGGKSFTVIDPFKKRNTLLLGMTFIIIFLCVVLLMASFYFSLNVGLGITVFIIALIILAIITVLIYIFRSGVFSK